MPLSAQRWKQFAESRYAHEREALDFLRDVLQDRDPNFVYSNFEFIADDGSVNEIDALVVTQAGVFLVELKSRGGTVRGNRHLWDWEKDSHTITVDSPLTLINSKARKLAGLLSKQRAFRERAPWIEALVFLSAPGISVRLPESERMRICEREPRDNNRYAVARVAQESAELRNREGPPRIAPWPAAIGKDRARLCGKGRGGNNGHQVCEKDPAPQCLSNSGRHISGVPQAFVPGEPHEFCWGGDCGPEVYHARDTKLKRDVALKVLPDAFARDPERMARFQREAEVLASLNHPNIAHLYGIEDHALVMELVEGQMLPCPLPIDDALKYSKQIAEALEYAHEKGVIHRDLKPANIKITPEGVVKVLDFGLAEPIDDPLPNADPSNSPTLTLGATRVGMILGTAAYMSPEQAAGAKVDRRADIWSFGAVLYETLTGKRAFPGESAADTLATVLRLDNEPSA